MTNSCSHYPTNPPSTKCDTCDTTTHPCDTCNIDHDSAAHAFTWTEYTIPDVFNVTGVAVFGPNSIYAIGAKLYAFDGTSWQQQSVTINGKSYLPLFTDKYFYGISETDYWAVSGDIAYHGRSKNTVDEYRLQTVGIYDITTDGPIRSCWGLSSKDMFFVGDLGTIFHFDGTTWTKFPKSTTKNLHSVWGSSHNDVWATGFNSSTDESVLLHYDGTSWKEDVFSTSNQTVQYGIGNVWASDSNGHSFAAISGTKVFRNTDNSTWRMDTSALHNELSGGGFNGLSIYGNTANDMMAVGGWGYVAHWNGKTWKKYKELYDYSNTMYGAAAFSMKGNTACVVGVKSGSSWIAIGRRK